MTDEDDAIAARRTSWLGAVALALLIGALSTEFRTFPYRPLLERPFEALRALKQKWFPSDDPARLNHWYRIDAPDTGVTHHDPDRAHTGFTLYTSSHAPAAHLVDMAGERVYRWRKPFGGVWSDPPHVESPVAEDNIYWGGAELLEDGALLAYYQAIGDTPWGYGLVKLDADAEVIWKFPAHVHHEIDVHDGAIYTLTQRFRDPSESPLPEIPQFDERFLEDFVVRLSPDGEVERRVSVVDAFLDTPYQPILETHPNWLTPSMQERRWDPLHTNAAVGLERDFTEHHPRLDPDDVLVSIRNIDTLAAIDLQSREVVWATRGFWTQQHDPDPLDDGNLLLFDNRGHGGPGGISRIVEFRPDSQAFAWSYHGDDDRVFWSKSKGSQQLLPNGNVLVTSSNQGRIFEVNREGRVVWEFRNPVRREHRGETFVPMTCHGRRYDAEEVASLPVDR